MDVWFVGIYRGGYFACPKTRIQLIRKETDREAGDGSTRAETVANSGEAQKERLKFPAVI